MDIKEYLAPRFSSNPFTEMEPPKRVKHDPNIAVKVSGVDFFITKETPKTKKTLVCIMSQNILYIRDEKTGVDTMANPELVRSFIGMTDVALVDDETGEECTWLGEVNRGKNSADWLCKIFERSAEDDFKYLLMKGFGYVERTSDNFPDWSRSSLAQGAHNYLPALFKRVPADLKKRLRKSFVDKLFGHSHQEPYDEPKKLTELPSIFMDEDLLHLIETVPGWGVSGLCDFVEEFFRSAATSFPEASSLASVIGKNRTYNYETRTYVSTPRTDVPRIKLQAYLFYNGVEEAGEDGINHFTKELGDYLSVREQLKEISHKEYPVFPENLFSMVQRISAIHRKYKKELESVPDADFEEYVKFLTKYEYAPDSKEFMIVAPKNKVDMLEEATHQCNCLSSYIKKVRDGECMVFFCRRKKCPRRSYVTISVRADGSLDQVLAARNKAPDQTVKSFVKEWHYKFFANTASA